MKILLLMLVTFTIGQQEDPVVLPLYAVGGDRDEHNCIGSAGYTWCASKNKCLRSWEEECPDHYHHQGHHDGHHDGHDHNAHEVHHPHWPRNSWNNPLILQLLTFKLKERYTDETYDDIDADFHDYIAKLNGEWEISIDPDALNEWYEKKTKQNLNEYAGKMMTLSTTAQHDLPMLMMESTRGTERCCRVWKELVDEDDNVVGFEGSDCEKAQNNYPPWAHMDQHFHHQQPFHQPFFGHTGFGHELGHDQGFGHELGHGQVFGRGLGFDGLGDLGDLDFYDLGYGHGFGHDLGYGHGFGHGLGGYGGHGYGYHHDAHSMHSGHHWTMMQQMYVYNILQRLTEYTFNIIFNLQMNPMAKSHQSSQRVANIRKHIKSYGRKVMMISKVMNENKPHYGRRISPAIKEEQKDR